jgi:hypothetical protein
MIENRNWTSQEILKFAEWLWENDQRSYSILAMHGVCWGIKIGNLLEMKWSDIIENGRSKTELTFDKEVIKVSLFCQKLNETLYKELRPEINSKIHINKTGKVIDTSNLSKNLQRLSEKYSKDCGVDLIGLNPLIGSSFQIAWLIDMLEFNHFSKNAFSDLAKHVKKKTVKDLEDYVGMKPMDTQIKYDLLDSKGAEIILQPIEMLNGKRIIKDFAIRFNNK